MLGCVLPEELNRICQRKYLRGVKLEPVGPRGAANTQKSTPDTRTGTCAEETPFLNKKKYANKPLTMRRRSRALPLRRTEHKGNKKTDACSGMRRLLNLVHWKRLAISLIRQQPAEIRCRLRSLWKPIGADPAGDFQFSLLRELFRGFTTHLTGEWQKDDLLEIYTCNCKTCALCEHLQRFGNWTFTNNKFSLVISHRFLHRNKKFASTYLTRLKK
jgi:hypothetical protein